MELGRKSGVSLPSIQKIEAGQGNPSLKTLDAICNVLGLKIELNPISIDWDILVYLGVPLITTKAGRKINIHKSPEILADYLKTACVQLMMNQNDPAQNRLREATQAMLLALQTHYPRFFKKYFSKCKPAMDILGKEIVGKIYKLRRLALTALSEYM